MSIFRTGIEGRLADYLDRFSPDEDDILVGINRDISERGPIPMQIAPDQGRFIATLARAISARRAVEVGCFFGYSAVWIARALGPEGHLDTVEASTEFADIARVWFEKAGLTDRITIHSGKGMEVLPGLSPGYDLLFIDADKESYPSYLAEGLRLVRPGGFILADNVFWMGTVANPVNTAPDTESIREFTRLASGHPRLETTVLPIGDGLSVSLVLS